MTSPQVITWAEAKAILGDHTGKPVYSEQLKRAIDKGCIPTVERDGVRMILREGLEESWRNRKQRHIKPRHSTSKTASPPPASPDPGAAPAAPRRPRRATRVTPQASPASLPVQAQALPTGGLDLSVLEGWALPEIPKSGVAPNLEDQKAWKEFTLRYRAQVELLKDANLLVFREDYDKAQNAVIQEIMRQLDILPNLIQQRIPKITEEDKEEIEDVIRTAREVVASCEFESLAA